MNGSLLCPCIIEQGWDFDQIRDSDKPAFPLPSGQHVLLFFLSQLHAQVTPTLTVLVKEYSEFNPSWVKDWYLGFRHLATKWSKLHVVFTSMLPQQAVWLINMFDWLDLLHSNVKYLWHPWRDSYPWKVKDDFDLDNWILGVIALKGLRHARIISLLWISDILLVMTLSKQFTSYHRHERLFSVIMFERVLL